MDCGLEVMSLQVLNRGEKGGGRDEGEIEGSRCLRGAKTRWKAHLSRLGRAREKAGCTCG